MTVPGCLVAPLVAQPAYYFNPVLSGTLSDYNMRAHAIAAGWSGLVPLIMTVKTTADCVIGASGYGYAFDTGVGFPIGSMLSLEHAGIITGKGGYGGNGDNFHWSTGYAGGAGGPALRAQHALSVNNGAGTIAGGGGGGGGTAYYPGDKYTPGQNGYGGGAGRGHTPTGGGYGGQGSGGTGTVSAPGGGGGGGAGAGGGWGAGGGSGTYGGGAPGAAVVGNANINWIYTGARFGAIVA